jgi:hypothetical protein
MDLSQQALRAGHHAPPVQPGLRRKVLVLGGAGALGSAVLEQLLGRGAFLQVGVTTLQPLGASVRGLTALPWPGEPALHRFAPDTALIVFDRERHANGRERALHRPEPPQLLVLATALHAAGVAQLIVVLPHDAAQMPEALRAGLANLDEQAVAALGFEHVLFMRPAHAPGRAQSASLLQRLALGVLAQLRLMVPQQQRPVRAVKVAAFAAELARLLPQAPAGTRVVPAELVWMASQNVDVGALAQRWLAGAAEPEPVVVPERM